MPGSPSSAAHRQPFLSMVHQQHKKTASPWVSGLLSHFIISLSFTNHSPRPRIIILSSFSFICCCSWSGITYHQPIIIRSKSFTALFAQSLAGLRPYCSSETHTLCFSTKSQGAGLPDPCCIDYRHTTLIHIQHHVFVRQPTKKTIMKCL